MFYVSLPILGIYSSRYLKSQTEDPALSSPSYPPPPLPHSTFHQSPTIFPIAEIESTLMLGPPPRGEMMTIESGSDSWFSR